MIIQKTRKYGIQNRHLSHFTCMDCASWLKRKKKSYPRKVFIEDILATKERIIQLDFANLY